MFRYVICSVLLAVIALPAEAQNTPGTARELVNKYRSSVFCIRTKRKFDDHRFALGYCTGFLVSKDPPLIITSGTVYSGAPEDSHTLVIASGTGKEYLVKAVHTLQSRRPSDREKGNNATDISIIELAQQLGDEYKALPLEEKGRDRNIAGERIVGIGIPIYGVAQSSREASKPYRIPDIAVREGSIVRMADADGDSTETPIAERPMFEHNSIYVEGEHGGPIFSLASGKVVGLHIGTMRRQDGRGRTIALIPLAIHVDIIHELLYEYENRENFK